MGGDHDRRAADIGDMGEVFHRIERWVGAGCRGDHVGRNSGDHEGGPVGIGTSNRGGTDHAARARPVLDDDALRERVAEMLGQDAADRVGASSGRPWHDDAHGLARPGLRRWRRRCPRLRNRWRDGGTGERADDRDPQPTADARFASLRCAQPERGAGCREPYPKPAVAPPSVDCNEFCCKHSRTGSGPSRSKQRPAQEHKDARGRCDRPMVRGRRIQALFRLCRRGRVALSRCPDRQARRSRASRPSTNPMPCTWPISTIASAAGSRR